MLRSVILFVLAGALPGVASAQEQPAPEAQPASPEAQPAAQAQPAPAAQPAAQATPPGPTAPAEPPVVVVPLPTQDLTPELVTAIRDAVVSAVAPLAAGRATVPLEDEQRLIAILECAEPSCIGAQLAEAAAIAGVLVRMERPRGRGPVTVTLELVDPVSGAPRTEPATVEIAADQLEAPGDAVRAAAGQLAPAMPAAPPRSSLLVAVNVDEATVTVDGNELGRSPVGVVEVPPGRHTVDVARAGFMGARRSIDVGRGEDARLDVVLEVDPANAELLAADAAPIEGAPSSGPEGPWYTRWYVIAGGGVVLAALIVGIVAVAASGGDDGGQAAIPVPPIE